jgi:hypothetical protein
MFALYRRSIDHPIVSRVSPGDERNAAPVRSFMIARGMFEKYSRLKWTAR